MTHSHHRHGRGREQRRVEPDLNFPTEERSHAQLFQDSEPHSIRRDRHVIRCDEDRVALTSSMPPPRRLGETGPNTVNCPDWLLAVLYPARCLSSRSMLSGRRVGTTGFGFVLRRGAVRVGKTGLGGIAGAVALGGVVTGRGGIGCAWPSAWPTAKLNTHEGDRSAAQNRPVSAPVFVRPETHPPGQFSGGNCGCFWWQYKACVSASNAGDAFFLNALIFFASNRAKPLDR